MECANIAYKINGLKDIEANNVGYVFLTQNMIEEAERLFVKAIETFESSNDSLPRYNMGLICLMKGEYGHAKEYILEAKPVLQSKKDKEDSCAVPLGPQNRGR